MACEGTCAVIVGTATTFGTLGLCILVMCAMIYVRLCCPETEEEVPPPLVVVVNPLPVAIEVSEDPQPVV